MCLKINQHINQLVDESGLARNNESVKYADNNSPINTRVLIIIDIAKP